MFDQNFNFNLRKDPQKNSHERRAYEAIDESYVTKNDEKKESGHKWVKVSEKKHFTHE